MQIISNIALISINETLIVQVISFLIFLFIINRVMFRPLRSLVAERQSHIEDIRQDIVAAGKKFESLTNQIEEQEAAVKMEAFMQKKNLEEAGGRQADEIFVSTQKTIAAEKDKALKEVDAQVLEAKKIIQMESEALALSIIEKVLDRRLNP
jgi:F-type H+-transporting ATPase subunit b